MARKPFNPDLIAHPPEGRRSPPAGPMTVSQITGMIQRAIAESLPPTLHVVGEISNFKRHSSGHLYLTLKDASSELACVMWRSAAAKLKFTPTDGLEILATGHVEVFERAGRYQLYIRKLEPRGEGALDLAFRQLRERLEREGLFDKTHKRSLPPCPVRIALVTSPTGAAVADMIRAIERRFPCVSLLIYPVRVQGDGAAREIAYAILKINADRDLLGGIDVMIVGRGGGSLEDLWAFNEEVVARAIHASRIPIISAVGHEVDLSIADLVADVRAATPTAAAELAVPVLTELLDGLDGLSDRMKRVVSHALAVADARFSAVVQRGCFRDPLALVHRREQGLDELLNRMRHAFVDRLALGRRALDHLEPTLQRIAPHVLFARTAGRLGDVQHRLRFAMARRAERAARAVAHQQQRIERGGPAGRLASLAQRVEHLSGVLPVAMRHRLALMAESLHGQEGLLRALSYKRVLGRGYSITRIKKGQGVVRSTDQLKDRMRVVTELADDVFESEVVNLNQLELFD